MYNLIFAVIILIITYSLFAFIKFRRYFEKWGIPHPSEVPFLTSWGSKPFKSREHLNTLAINLYNLNKEAKYVGCHVLLNPVIIVRDLDLVKSVLVKNFDHFADHKNFVDETSDPLFGKNLTFLTHDKWREVRNLLSPAFTSSKMRTMFALMSPCADNFTKQFSKLYGNEEAINMNDIFARYANDVIATCAFGIEVDSLKNPDNEFYAHGRSATFTGGFKFFNIFLMVAFPKIARAVGLRLISKKDTDFFINVIGMAIKAREQQNIKRPDMLQLMMDAREKNLTTNLDLLEITALSFIFFLGGLGTTSEMMCMIAYELAMNPKVQSKLQAEIDNMMKDCNNEPTYDSINNMSYLDNIFTETLRVHSLGFLGRMCTKEFELPPALPHSKPYLMKPGMEIFVPVSAIHVDPDYYENPHEFKPERHENKKAAISDSISLGFGLGPRVCIGNRFAILETKVLFVHLLAKCSLVPCEKTCIPLKYDLNNFIPSVKGDCWLQVKLRN